MKSFLLLLAITSYSSAQVQQSKLDKALSVFDMDFDDLVIEKGENWAEKYYIR